MATGPAPTPSGKMPPASEMVQDLIVPTKAGQPSSASAVILLLALEILAVGLFTLVGGISNDVANLVILFMVGLWLIYFLTDSKTLASLGSGLNKIAAQS